MSAGDLATADAPAATGRARGLRTPGNLALLAVLASGYARLALQYAPRPWSAFGHIDIAQLLAAAPFFERHWPYWTFPFEYHPVIGWVSAVLSYLTGELVLVVVAWLVLMALFARATADLVARQVGTRRAIVFWALAPQLLLFGGKNFDAIAVFTLVYASLAIARGGMIRAGASIAVGAATKLFPLVGLPPYLVAMWREGRRRGATVLAAATLAVLALIDLGAVIAPYSLLRYGVSPYGVASWNIDSIWFPVAILLAPFLTPELNDRVISGVSLLGLAVTYAVLVLRPAARGADPQRLMWLSVAILVFWTRLRSSQYAIWLLPMFALYVPDARLLAFMFVGDAVSFFGVFALRGEPRDVLSPDALPYLAAIIVGVIVRQIAVLRLIALGRPREP